MSESDDYIKNAIELALAATRASGSKIVAYYLELALYEHKEATVINDLKLMAGATEEIEAIHLITSPPQSQTKPG